MYNTLGEKLENNVHNVTFKKVIDYICTIYWYYLFNNPDSGRGQIYFSVSVDITPKPQKS